MTEQHCPGCRGYTAGWEGECPGLLAPEAVPPERVPLDMAGHVVFSAADGSPLPGRCHCRWHEPHFEDAVSPR